jgi:putative nucleotidyltransferase with HDIG domain
MRFRTRAFLLWLLPVATLLSISFWMIEGLVQSTVHGGIRDSLRVNHTSLASARARAEVRNRRFLRIASENTALKAGLQLLLVEGATPAAQATLEDELQDLCEKMGFDLFIAASHDHIPLAGVVRVDGRLRVLAPADLPPVSNGILPVRLSGERKNLYQTASVPVELNGEPLGVLVVGELFDFAEFSTPAVLSAGGHVLRSSVPGASPSELEKALAACPAAAECDIEVGGTRYLSSPMENRSLGDGYTLRSLQSLDAAIQPVRRLLRLLFVSVFGVAVLIAICCGAVSARSIVQPISALVEHLRRTERTGVLPQLELSRSGIREMDDLTATFNRAAVAAAQARESLEGAYVQFVATLAAALDARDRYTAGHSHRVAELSCRLAGALQLPPRDTERIRMGALLHDIGKLGVSDLVLQKAGTLTEQEIMLIRQHPRMGRQILEKVEGFAVWLDAVELHHENWDGTGYPHGLCGDAIPLDARIIHVADAWDAMTTDRPYRKAKKTGDAVATLQAGAGLDFDPRVVEALVQLIPAIETETCVDSEIVSARPPA